MRSVTVSNIHMLWHDDHHIHVCMDAEFVYVLHA